MPYVIQLPEGAYLHPDTRRENMVADHGIRTTYGPFWTLEKNEAMRFDTWFQAEARAGILFWDRSQRNLTFNYQDTIKEIEP